MKKFLAKDVTPEIIKAEAFNSNPVTLHYSDSVALFMPSSKAYTSFLLYRKFTHSGKQLSNPKY